MRRREVDPWAFWPYLLFRDFFRVKFYFFLLREMQRTILFLRAASRSVQGPSLVLS